ncbi:MAG: helix-turn-helix domain-containing protein [Oscillospiraceae bacterium]|nr:helix-turn-helix domain-containing protein [Oscillospiraceae bacterium]
MNNMNLADKVQNLRREKQLSQEELAEKLDISRQSVSKWESGLAMPEIDKLIMLSEIFGVTTDYLLKSDESFHPDSSNTLNISNDEDISEKEEMKRLLYLMKFGMIISLLSVSSLIGQFLLNILSIISNNNLGYSIGYNLCFVLSVIGLVLTFGAKISINFKYKKNYSFSLYKTLCGKFGMLFSFIAILMLILASYSYNPIIATFCFLFWCATTGLYIFAIIRKKLI